MRHSADDESPPANPGEMLQGAPWSASGLHQDCGLSSGLRELRVAVICLTGWISMHASRAQCRVTQREGGVSACTCPDQAGARWETAKAFLTLSLSTLSSKW